MPTWNNDGSGLPGGYGLFQITGSPTDSEADIPRRQIWNWQDNIFAYFAIMRDPIKSGLATRFYNDVKDDSPTHQMAFDQCLPLEIPVDNHTFPSSEAIWITAYNGWGGPIKTRYVFDPFKACGLDSTLRWFWNPPNNPDEPYSDKFKRQIDP